MCPFRVSTTADIYSHLNYSSKLNVANTLTSVFGDETKVSGKQDSTEAQALLTALFRGSEHEQAEGLSKPVKAVADAITPVLEEELEEVVETEYGENLAISEYRQAKADMERLGFIEYDDYLDYLEFMQRKTARKSNMEM